MSIGGNDAWKCFDQNTSTAWGSAACSSSGPQYIGYTFNEPVAINSFSLNNRMPIDFGCETFRLEASNDNFATKDILFTDYKLAMKTNVHFYVPNNKKYKSYRIAITAAFLQWAGLCEMQLYS